MTTIEERFWGKVEFTDTCWLWTASGVREYGCFYVDGGNVYAHRWAYEFCVGPIPEGLELDHLCRVSRCVNPDDLEIVTHRVNVLRGFGLTAANVRKTHCAQGHPFDAENTYLRPDDGTRQCRRCTYIRTWERRHAV